MNACKRFEKLLPGYLLGELYEGEYNALQEHLKSCTSCLAKLEAQYAALQLAGRALKNAPAPTRLTARRATPEKRLNVRRGTAYRIWSSPQFKAIAATAVIAAVCFFLSGMFVVFSVLPKSAPVFEVPPPIEAVHVTLPMDGMDSLALADYDGASRQRYDKSNGNRESLSEVAAERPRMALKKPTVKVKKSSAPKPSTRIVANVKMSPMPEINIPDIVGTGEGLMGGGLGYDDHVSCLGCADTDTDGFEAAEVAAMEEMESLFGASSSERSYDGAVDEMESLFGEVAMDSRDVPGEQIMREGAEGNTSDFGQLFAADEFKDLEVDRLHGAEKEYAQTGDSRWVDAYGYEAVVDVPELVREPAAFNPYVLASENAFSTFSIDVDTAAYGLARQYIFSEGVLPEPESVRTEEFINSFDYDYRPPSGSQTFAVHTEMAPSPFRSGMELFKVGIKGRRIGRDDHRGVNLTLVIDTSGSMGTPERLGLIKESLSLLLDQLNPEDRVAIVQFGGEARLVCEHIPVSEKAVLVESINQLQAAGPTQFDQGLELGYQMAADGFVGGDSNRMIILSDGVANLGEIDPESILEQVASYRKKGIYLSVLGFGAGSYDDDLLERLANRGDGSYAYVDSLDEARYLFVDQLAATLHVIAGDVKIQIEFNPARVLRYRQLGYENRQLTQEQFRDDSVDAGEVGSGQSVTALYDVELKSGAPSDEPIAKVYVRYRREDNGVVEEISRTVSDAVRVERFSDAAPRFKLAACVAELAEHLRCSPYAQGTDAGDISSALQPVVLALDLDEQVQELQRLISAVVGLEH